MSVNIMDQMQRTMSAPVDTASIQGIRDQLSQATFAAQELDAAVRDIDVQPGSPTISTPELQSNTIQVAIEPVVMEQPQITVPDNIVVPINPIVEQQPVIEVPDGLNVPVTAEVIQQPKIEIPDDLKVPVTLYVTEQPTIDVPEEIQVLVEPVVTQQPQIDISNDTKIQELTNKLNGITEMQKAIKAVGSSLYVLPEDSAQDISKVSREITQVQQALDFLKSNPFSLDSSVAELQIQAMGDSLDDLIARQQNLDNLMGNAPSRIIQVDVEANIPNPLVKNPSPIEVPIEWKSYEGLDVFTTTGIERFEQEISNVNSMIEELQQTQSQITQQASHSTILFPQAVTDIQNVESRVRALQQMIEQVESNPLNVGSDSANSELERVRGQLNQTILLQDNLNRAMQGMDISEINTAYLQLSQNISDAEKLVRDSFSNIPPVKVPVVWQSDNLEVFTNTGIERFQQEIQSTNSMLDNLINTQAEITRQAESMEILPAEAVSDIQVLHSRVQGLQASIAEIERNKLDIGSDEANTQLERLRTQLNQILTLENGLKSDMSDMGIEQINNAYLQISQTISNVERTIRDSFSNPVEIPVTWNTDNVQIFTSTGIKRFQQEIQSANFMLSTLNTTQTKIATTATQTSLFSTSAISDISNLQNRLQAIQRHIQQVESNPLNIGSSAANAQLEQLRIQLGQAIEQQEALNSAVEQMDVSAANEAYLRLSQTIGNTERYIRDNTSEQDQFNHAIGQGTQEASNLTRMIKSAVAAYVSIQSIGKIIDLSDTMTQTTARLDLIVDDGGSVQELQNRIYASAQNARGSYLATSDAVSKLGMQASQAFSSNDELIAFTELLNKQFVNAGTSAQGVESVMLQLTQAMAAGKLQGEELNAVLDNASPIVQNIQQYLEEVQGIDASNIKDLASEGALTADIIKSAMFYAADEINAKFESMPMTWGQVWQSMQNTALVAFQPVLNKINEIANSDGFQTITSDTITALATLAGFALEIITIIGSFVAENWSVIEIVVQNIITGLEFLLGVILSVLDVALSVAQGIIDNWSIISPIIYGIIGALAVYGAYLAITKGIELASAAAKGVMAVMEGIHAVAIWATTSATWAETTAQLGLNSAMYACPIVWIVGLIIGLIAIIYGVCTAIAKLTGAANTGFGMICGGINVTIQFFKNLGLSVANISLGISSAILAVCSNMKTAFHNAICSVQAWFYDLLSTALSVIGSIAAELNKLPFVEFDYSGITSAADAYAAKSAAAAGNKEEYTSISEAFNAGMSTFDTFQDGWAAEAFESGAAWGDGVADKVSSALDSMFDTSAFDESSIPQAEGYANTYVGDGGYTNVPVGGLNEIGGGVGDIAGNTGAIADTLDVTEEDLKYLRDIAEQETVNRYTIAEITIEQTNHNNVSEKMDLDGIVDGLTDAVDEAVEIITEGVHV